MKSFYLAIALGLSLGASANPEKPTQATAPKGTIPYSKELCKTRDGKRAYAFVKIKPKFDKNGCTRPVKAWIYNEKRDNWHYVNPEKITCCDPSAAAGLEP
ncbi:MAG: hypothetical protein K2X47_12630 [Bdellovibrionales bacterium]|nr:hypothetical protein [Bdellovibrionales bacterium]